MKGSELFDREKAHFNLARLNTAGEKFEVIIEPDKAVAYREGSLADVREAIKYEKIFSDAKKGLLASETSMQKNFKTAEPAKVAEIILAKGVVQLTSAYRDSFREAKRRQLIEFIHRNAVDPKTGFPHPVSRLENAFAEAKVRIDEHKKAEEQLEDVLKQLRPIIPIRFETKRLQILIPPSYAPKAYPVVKSFGRVIRQTWENEGSLLSVIEIPAGAYQGLVEQLNKLTHGSVDIKSLEAE